MPVFFSNAGEKEKVWIWMGREVDKMWKELEKEKSQSEYTVLKINF